MSKPFLDNLGRDTGLEEEARRRMSKVMEANSWKVSRHHKVVEDLADPIWMERRSVLSSEHITRVLVGRTPGETLF